MSFLLMSTPLAGLMVVQREAHIDARGHFARLFCADELAACGWAYPMAQVNHSRTLGIGVVRGLHYQIAPHAEMKLVSCLHGAVWDVAVDLRKGSATYLQWHGQLLSADNQQAMLIPAGFAHGFQAQTEQADLLYCHSHAFCEQAQAALNALDPCLGLEWPLPIAARSQRDERVPYIDDSFEGIAYGEA